jgi:hypothetical protein
MDMILSIRKQQSSWISLSLNLVERILPEMVDYTQDVMVALRLFNARIRKATLFVTA